MSVLTWLRTHFVSAAPPSGVPKLLDEQKEKLDEAVAGLSDKVDDIKRKNELARRHDMGSLLDDALKTINKERDR